MAILFMVVNRRTGTTVIWQQLWQHHWVAMYLAGQIYLETGRATVKQVFQRAMASLDAFLRLDKQFALILNYSDLDLFAKLISN